jgi:hypothetical protein
VSCSNARVTRRQRNEFCVRSGEETHKGWRLLSFVCLFGYDQNFVVVVFCFARVFVLFWSFAVGVGRIFVTRVSTYRQKHAN